MPASALHATYLSGPEKLEVQRRCRILTSTLACVLRMPPASGAVAKQTLPPIWRRSASCFTTIRKKDDREDVSLFWWKDLTLVYFCRRRPKTEPDQHCTSPTQASQKQTSSRQFRGGGCIQWEGLHPPLKINSCALSRGRRERAAADARTLFGCGGVVVRTF